MAVVLVGTLDTKGHELAFVGEILRGLGLETITIDVGTLGPPVVTPDIGRDRVMALGGGLPSGGDRGEAVAAAARGAAIVARELHAAGRVQGIFALGGSAGTTIGTAAMRALPFGLPKLMLSTLASGQTRQWVGGSDLILMPSVADLAGLNRITRTVLANAAHAMAGMVLRPTPAAAEGRRVVAATMFGVTTRCVDRARSVLEASACEVLVFHATGVGGQAMEALIEDGQVDGVLDLTTTELADELVGGILSAGPDRLEAAGRRGVPQVVGVGAMDMVNFGPRETVPSWFAGRKFHAHNPAVTLMRTTAEECAALGRRLAEVLGRATGPTAVILPLGGVSALDTPGGPFYDAEADAALFGAIRDGLSRFPRVRLVERTEHVNDTAFADEAARLLLDMIGPRGDNRREALPEAGAHP